MGVLEKLRIQPENDDEYPSEFEPEYERESGEEPNQNNWDPEPGQAPARPSQAKAKLSQVRDAAPRVTKRMRDEAQGEVESILQVLALTWGWQAPPCGQALEDAAPEISQKLIKILARNPRWLQRVRDGGLIADVLGLVGTLGPVARVAYAHYTQPREESTDGVVFDPDRFAPYDGTTGFSRAG